MEPELDPEWQRGSRRPKMISRCRGRTWSSRPEVRLIRWFRPERCGHRRFARAPKSLRFKDRERSDSWLRADLHSILDKCDFLLERRHSRSWSPQWRVTVISHNILFLGPKRDIPCIHFILLIRKWRKHLVGVLHDNWIKMSSLGYE